MSATSHVASLLDHVEWANRRVLAALQTQPEISVRTDALKLFAHVLGSERVWYARVQGDTDVPTSWPPHSLADLPTEMERNLTDWRTVLSTEGALDREIEYHTTAGVEHRNRLVDIVTHVALHGAYHRGQIAWVLRHGAGEPLSTDFITMVREG